jgi:hypothetical protein
VAEVGRKIVGAVVAHRRIGLDFVDRQGLEDVGAEGDKIGNLFDYVEERGSDAWRARIVRADVQLVDDHVAEVRCDESGIVPGIGGRGANQAAAIGKLRGWRQFARVGIALVTGRTESIDPETIRIALARGVHKPSPVSVAVVDEKQVVGLSQFGRAAEGAIDVDSRRKRRPGAKAGTPGDEVRTHGSVRGDVCLGDHQRYEVVYCGKLKTIG